METKSQAQASDTGPRDQDTHGDDRYAPHVPNRTLGSCHVMRIQRAHPDGNGRSLRYVELIVVSTEQELLWSRSHMSSSRFLPRRRLVLTTLTPPAFLPHMDKNAQPCWPQLAAPRKNAQPFPLDDAGGGLPEIGGACPQRTPDRRALRAHSVAHRTYRIATDWITA